MDLRGSCDIWYETPLRISKVPKNPPKRIAKLIGSFNESSYYIIIDLFETKEEVPKGRLENCWNCLRYMMKVESVKIFFYIF